MNITTQFLVSAVIASTIVSSALARDVSPKEYEIFIIENLRAEYTKLSPDIQSQIKADYDAKNK